MARTFALLSLLCLCACALVLVSGSGLADGGALQPREENARVLGARVLPSKKRVKSIPLSDSTSHPKSPSGPKASKPAAAGQPSRSNKNRLSDTEHLAKWNRFVEMHPKRAKGQDGFKIFRSNRQRIVELNDRHGTPANPTPFKSTSPFAALSPQAFKKTVLKAKIPRSYLNKAGVRKITNDHFVNAGDFKTTKLGNPNPPKVDAPMFLPAAYNLPKFGVSNAKANANAPKVTFKSLLEVEQEVEHADPIFGTGHRVGGTTKATRTGSSAGGTTKGTRTGSSGGASGNDTSSVDLTKAKQITLADIQANLVKGGVPSFILTAAFKKLKTQTFVGGHGTIFQQSDCYGCWAQVASNAIFVMHARYFQGEPFYRPSVQQLLDCVHTSETDGCNGGTPMDALEWMSKNIVAPDDSYPRLDSMSVGTCKTFPKPFDSLTSYGWEFAAPACKQDPCNNQQQSEVGLLQTILDDDASVPIVYVDSTNWQAYSSGIFPASLCGSNLADGNHVVEISGFATDDVTGVPYWIIRNSWGTTWGEKGFIRLPFGVNACGLANFAIVPKRPNDASTPNGSMRHSTGNFSTSKFYNSVSYDNSRLPSANYYQTISSQAQAAQIAQGNKPFILDGNIQVAPNGVKYNPDLKMWFDPSRGGWTSAKPANAPAGMGK